MFHVKPVTPCILQLGSQYLISQYPCACASVKERNSCFCHYLAPEQCPGRKVNRWHCAALHTDSTKHCSDLCGHVITHLYCHKLSKAAASARDCVAAHNLGHNFGQVVCGA